MPIHIAASIECMEVLKHFVETVRVPINSQNHDQDTPLHMAARHNREAAALYLMKHNADPNSKNRFGETPYSIANPTLKEKLIPTPPVSSIKTSPRNSDSVDQDRDRIRSMSSTGPRFSNTPPQPPSQPSNKPVIDLHIDYKSITIGERIGEGSYGTVYRGRLMGLDVAVKQFKGASSFSSVENEIELLRFATFSLSLSLFFFFFVSFTKCVL
jgi:hypothetical protein